MADLSYPPFANNLRISLAASSKNNPIAVGEPDREAVKTLQQALMSVGISLQDGADGIFGPHTAAAVRMAEIKYGLRADSGRAGPEVIGALDRTLGVVPPQPPKPQFPCTITIALQVELSGNPLLWSEDFKNSIRLMAEYGIEVLTIPKTWPRVVYRDPQKSDVIIPLDREGPTDLRIACETMVPGMVKAYRCIFGNISAENGNTNASTYSLGRGELNDSDIKFPMNPFSIFSSFLPTADSVGLVHELIHAVGFHHDSDPSVPDTEPPDSVFYPYSPPATQPDKFRTKLYQHHAEAISKSIFASTK